MLILNQEHSYFLDHQFQSMREETDSNSQGDATDSHSTPKDAYTKKRAIRKEKIQNVNERKTDDGTNKPTREERAKIQKEKNRQAAQRSRDLHREYVTKLQNEVHDLKQQLQISKRLCHRCSKPLDTDELNFFNTDNPVACDAFPETCRFQKEYELQIVGLQMEKEMVGGYNNDFLVRVEENSEDNSYIAMMLLVAMVAIMVIVTIHTPHQIDHKARNLLELYPLQSPPTGSNEIMTPQANFDSEGKINDYGSLIQWKGSDNQICLDSLMRVGPAVVKSSLRRLDQYEIDSGVLVCSYKTPKVYSLSDGLNTSPLVKMFILGSEVKQMLTTSSGLQRYIDKNIQLNGIYRLSAQIRSVDLVTQHNCLL